MNTRSQQLETAESECARLFVYGTLLRGFENAAFLQSPEKVTFLGIGTIEGQLFDLGPFPAFVLSSNNTDAKKTEIKGEIHKIEDPEVLFETLDLIEGYNHQHPERSLFIREKVTARTENGEIEVWVYIYHQSLDGSRLIESGDYRAYKIESTKNSR
jgi:gamma-glutamylcyclotransferase (GGCT)/AIG2-like uncharacterized protein YtfP